jgi:transposase
MMTGVFHLSRRQTKKLLLEVFDLKIAVGSISNIEGRMSTLLAPVYDEAKGHADKATVKHTDGTGWRQSGVGLQLWTVATAAVSVYTIVANGSAATLKTLFDQVRGILVSDRAKAINFWAMKRRQICWSHLLRKFISFSERDGPVGKIGTELVEYTSVLFKTYQAYGEGTISRRVFRERMVPVRVQIEALLEKAVAANLKRLSGSCKDILAHREALWTFVDRSGVEPTNNHAERELRAFVLWRKRSFGTQSDRGNRYAERIMTVVHSLRKQKRPVLSYLTTLATLDDPANSPPLASAA